jgi:ABC-type transport system substrate-binding protein
MPDFKLQHLITTGAREAEMIEALLNDNQIEVIVRHDEFGGYSMIYMGYYAYNIELYVAKVDYEKAKELLNDLNIDTNKKVDQEITKEDENKNKSVSFYLAQIAKVIIIIYLLLQIIALLF